MAEIRYCDLVQQTSLQQITTMGLQSGPPGGDGWTPLPIMAHGYMQDVATSYVIIVRGKIGNVQVVGGTPVRGMIEVCLGTAGGTLHPNFFMSTPVADAVPAGEGIPFEFMVMIDPAFSDSLLGTSLDPSVTDLRLYARTFWNGDTPNYAVTFEVGDVSWLWFDTTNIPAGHWIGDRDIAAGSGSSLSSTVPTSFRRLVSTPIGANGEKWLAFANVWYDVKQAAAPAPVFRFAVTPDGTAGAAATVIGSGGRWGMRRMWSPALAGALTSNVQQGGFAVVTPGNSTTQFGYFAHESPVASMRTLFRRWSFFAVRIDTLPDVRSLAFSTPQALGVGLSNPLWTETYKTIERPAPIPGILTEPVLLLHGIIQASQRTGYDAILLDNPGSQQPFPLNGLFSQSDPAQGEGVSSIGLGRRIYQTTSPAMQWRAGFVGAFATAPPAVQVCQDFCFCMFHPVRDAENLSDPPGTTPSPIIVVPGKQSADAGSLLPPPFLPNANPQERGIDERGAIVGATGYRRTWPLGAKVQRAFSLGWGPMPFADAKAVFDFLRANPAWRYTPPRGPAIAVLSSGAPRLMPNDHRNASVAVDVVVLAFTGS